MALDTETDRIKVCKALKVTPDTLNAKILWLGSRLTPALDAAVVGLADDWIAVPNDGIEIYPTGSNEGVRKSRSAVRAEIVEQIAVLLEFDDLIGSSDSFEIVRG